MTDPRPSIRPDLQTMRRVEELLREQLLDLGIDIEKIPPADITLYMHCAIYPNGTLFYSWQGRPLLDVEPEEKEDGTILWHFFARENPLQ